MNEQLSFEADSFELDQATETSGGHGCSCCHRQGAGQFEELDQEIPWPSSTSPVWVNTLFKLFRAGRLGWKAGRWIDKQTGRAFGKSISDRGADFL